MVRVKKVAAAAVVPASVCQEQLCPLAEKLNVEVPVPEVQVPVVEAPIKKMSGLHMLRFLTPEARDFFQKKPKEQMSRVQITIAINKYIKDHGLQKNDADKRLITPDDVLRRLLKVDASHLDASGQFMYKDVQKYYSHLFTDVEPQ